MKQITILLSFIITQLIVCSQNRHYRFEECHTLANPYLSWSTNSVGSPSLIKEYAPKLYFSPEHTPCNPFFSTESDENDRIPIQPFNFQKLRFETNYGFYLRITLEIDALGYSVVVLKDDYYAELTTIKSRLSLKDFEKLMYILARCDFDSFRDENISEDFKCCKSYFEISFNDETIKSRECSFFPFKNSELEKEIWRLVLRNIHRKGPSQFYYY